MQEVTNLEAAAARQLLEATNWSIEEAIALNFAGGAGEEDGVDPHSLLPESGLGTSVVHAGGSTGSGGARANSSASGRGAPPATAGSGASSAAGSGAGAGNAAEAGGQPAGQVEAASNSPGLLERWFRTSFGGEPSPPSGEAPLLPGTPGSADASAPAAAAANEDLPGAANADAGGFLGMMGQALTNLGHAVLGVASEDFGAWFAARFGEPTPPFCSATLGDANKQALQDGRVLVLWFHREEPTVTDRFCRDVLQNDIVLGLLRRSFTFWAGDVSRFEPSQVAKLLGCTAFPTLVVALPLRSGFDEFGAEHFCLEWPLGTFAQPLIRLTPERPGETLSVDEVIAALTGAAEDHQDAVRDREAETQLRDLHFAEERRLREEQDREYEEALLADQMAAVAAQEQAASSEEAAKQAAAAENAAAKARAAEEAAAEEARRSAAEEEAAAEARRLARRAELLAEGQEDAAAGSGSGKTTTAKVSLRLPSGDRLQRVFAASRLVSEVYEWAHCCRPVAQPAKFELCTNFPVKALTDRSITVEEAGLCPSSALLLRATED